MVKSIKTCFSNSWKNTKIPIKKWNFQKVKTMSCYYNFIADLSLWIRRFDFHLTDIPGCIFIPFDFMARLWTFWDKKWLNRSAFATHELFEQMNIKSSKILCWFGGRKILFLYRLVRKLTRNPPSRIIFLEIPNIINFCYLKPKDLSVG